MDHWGAATTAVIEPNVSGHTQIDGLVATNTSPEVEAANAQLIADYIDTALVKQQWQDVDRFFDNGRYVLHGPLFADGIESVRSFFTAARDAGTPLVYLNPMVVLSSGEYVLAVSRTMSGNTMTAYWDLWRITDGFIAEHWDIIQHVPSELADGYFAELPTATVDRAASRRSASAAGSALAPTS
jgi:predicted SnoaL-like aldol condensation-catalyzing enzyme